MNFHHPNILHDYQLKMKKLTSSLYKKVVLLSTIYNNSSSCLTLHRCASITGLPNVSSKNCEEKLKCYHSDIIHEALQNSEEHSSTTSHHQTVTTALGKKTNTPTIFYHRSREEWIKLFKERQNYGIIGHMNFNIIDVPKEGVLIAEIPAVSLNHMAPNGFMHAASIVFLAGR